MKRLLLSNMVGLAALGLAACGGNECKLDDPRSCPSEQLCEVVQGQEKPACFAPVQLQGRVFDLESGEAIAGARVNALDVNGSPISAVAVTNDSGNYTLRIPSDRADEAGTPLGRKLTLRAAARDYQTFPSGLRVSLPLETGAAAAAKEGEPWVVSGGQADVALARVPEAEVGQPSISGTVAVSGDQRGVLVVAEQAGQPGHAAIADLDGSFTIFNVPPGTWSVRAYSRGVNYTPAEATVEAGKDVTGLKVELSQTATATLVGTVQIVSATGLTSVVLVPAPTFNVNLGRGEVPAGLRAPEPGTAPNVDGTFSIEGVPDGEYVVLAAFENDGLVRDPNPNTGGTTLQRITVSGGAISGEPAFKVTDAIQMVGPGAGDSPEEASATPTFSFKPYSSSAAYDVLVFDTLGNEIWKATALTLPSSGTLTVQYGGSTALVPGNTYQWRAVAYGQAGNPISRTEDLKGIFRVK